MRSIARLDHQHVVDVAVDHIVMRTEQTLRLGVDRDDATAAVEHHQTGRDRSEHEVELRPLCGHAGVGPLLHLVETAAHLVRRHRQGVVDDRRVPIGLVVRPVHSLEERVPLRLGGRAARDPGAAQLPLQQLVRRRVALAVVTRAIAR